HDGTYVKIPPRPIHPKPLQKPHPKIYYACTNPSSLQATGERGISALVLGLGGPGKGKDRRLSRQREDRVRSRQFRPSRRGTRRLWHARGLHPLCPEPVRR